MNTFYKDLGLNTENTFHFNQPNNFYIEETIKMGLGQLTKDGSLVVQTGKHTGRSANDRYIVKSPKTQDSIWWENNLRPMSKENFSNLKEKVINFLNSKNDLYVTDRSVGAHSTHSIGVRLISSQPQYALFSNHLFRDSTREFSEKDFTILHAPELEIDKDEFQTRSETVVVTCFDTNTTIITGTRYAGEIKKSMFAAMNYRLPEVNILPMHAGASSSANSETSVFFGLSGTGKTTLSTDIGTILIGDDEHGLSDEGVFNFEGGCYAKTYKLSKDTEPEIYNAVNRYGAMLENVVISEDGSPDFNDKSLTENGRASYPLEYIDELEKSGSGKLPSHIYFLSADAFGVLPPVSKLTKEQAMFYFVLGYTAKLAGTEIGIVEPTATFSSCFGAPFMIRHPNVYASLLGDFLDKHGTHVWLINTGWTGGPYGEGQRFPLLVTRKIIRAIQSNSLNETDTESDPIFGLNVPLDIAGVDKNILSPQKTWKNQDLYAPKAKELAVSFHNQMKKFGDFYLNNIKGAPLYKE